MRVGATLLIACGFVCCSFAASPAFAGPAESKHALELAYEGDDLYARSKWNEAFERFSEADKLAHSPVFVLYMARCRKNSGRLLDAAPIYERVSKEQLAADAPKPFRTAVSDAATELSEVRARTPKARIEVKKAPAKEVEIFVDDHPVKNDAPLPLDPGSHVFVAKSAGKEAKRTMDLPESSTETPVEIDFGSPAGAVDKPPPIVAKRGSLVPGAVVLSVGVAGLIVGGVTGGIALSKSGDIKQGCVGGHCLKSDASALDNARLLANVSTATFIIGGAAAVTGIVLLAVRPGGSSGPTVTAAPGFVSVRGSF